MPIVSLCDVFKGSKCEISNHYFDSNKSSKLQTMNIDKQGFELNKIPQAQLVAFYGLPFAAASADGNFYVCHVFRAYPKILSPLYPGS